MLFPLFRLLYVVLLIVLICGCQFVMSRLQLDRGREFPFGQNFTCKSTTFFRCIVALRTFFFGFTVWRSRRVVEGRDVWADVF